MSKKYTLYTIAGIASMVLATLQQTQAHMEPKKNENQETCYGVVKSGKNDCASKANKHACATMGRKDKNPNEWIKLPKGLCDKLVGGSTEAKG